ncbi:MAG TPA: GatB/YqeY domain-containing protein [Acidobacteriaceae bacterium]|nr:GatB/YqeY domain-containing protein [Acidobacteriaceae bacterium]
MPTIAERLNTDITAAMKSRAEAKLTTLRMVKSALRSREIDKREPLTEAEEQSILKTLIKQRRDSVEQFTKGGRPELAEKERAEIGMIEVYLPKQAQEDDILPIIRGAIAHVADGNGGQRPGPKDMGPTMRVVQQRILSSGLFVDSKTVSDLVKKELAGDRPLTAEEANANGGYGG